MIGNEFIKKYNVWINPKNSRICFEAPSTTESNPFAVKPLLDSATQSFGTFRRAVQSDVNESYTYMPSWKLKNSVPIMFLDQIIWTPFPISETVNVLTTPKNLRKVDSVFKTDFPTAEMFASHWNSVWNHWSFVPREFLRNEQSVFIGYGRALETSEFSIESICCR